MEKIYGVDPGYLGDDKELLERVNNYQEHELFNLLSSLHMVFFYMEHKKGNLKEYYALSLDKKKSKWRVLIQMLDENDKVLEPTDNEKEFLKSVKKIRIKELSEHYGEY